ncbi:MAG: adenine deaminase [Nitrospirae bacterium RBG_13_39_12]|nr:MAG: adenine deaminase [Nitrospirae bacterium RBG_13_39_12]
MKKKIKTFSGNIVDVLKSEIYPGTIKISNRKISDVIREDRKYDTYILPGFIDAHFHVESSMLVPSELARIVVIHGTVAVLSDPHEIANVMGVEGVRYMIDNAKTVPVKFYFGAPSCVPASDYETSGANIGPEQIEELLKMVEIKFLAEVMNFPGVIHALPDVMKKIDIAKRYKKVIDGHSPGLRGKDLRRYVKAGISTDHECFQKDEALEKLRLGMKIIIREGSAAKNFDELIPVVDEHYKNCMFCSDDKHPDELIRGHINDLVKRAVDYGIDLMKVLRVACVNPVSHYKLDIGLLRKGDNADFIVVDNLRDFKVLKTIIRGEIVAEEGRSLVAKNTPAVVNNFKMKKKKAKDFFLACRIGKIHIIKVIDGQVITDRGVTTPSIVNGNIVSDIKRDVLKIVVVNRYNESKVAIGFVKNFGLKKGAIASSVAHDSHNIIAVGVTDKDICRAVNLIIENKSGICAVSQEKEMLLPLPIAGIMSNEECSRVAEKYSALNKMAKSLGSTLHSPFMTLSFMALLVIPKIKLGDKGLFDGEKFEFIDVFEG